MPNPVPAILGATAISAGASALGANRQSSAIERGVDAQVAAARETNASNERMMERQIELQEPFRGLGVAAINPLADLLGLDYQATQTPSANVTAQPTVGNDPFITGTLVRGGDGTLRPSTGEQRLGPANMDTQAYLTANPDVMRAYPGDGIHGLRSADQWARLHYHNYGQNEGRNLPLLEGPPSGAAMAEGGQGAPVSEAMTPAQRQTSAMDALRERPGYNFRFNEGQRAIDSSAAARGMTMSGANIRAQTRYGQDFASNEYDREINRLLAVMGGGQVATNNQQTAMGNFGAMANANNMNAGQARASGYNAQGQAWSNGLNGIGTSVMGGLGMYGGSQGWFGNGMG